MTPIKYTIGVLAGVVLTYLVVVSLFIAALGKPLESGRWVSECLTIKQAAVQKINPKIIILSGSNSLYGFSAQRLTEVHGIASVNAAVNVGLGIDYILYYGRQLLAPGRIVVLPLEYSLYGTRRLSNSPALYQMVGYDTDYFWHLAFADKLTVIGEITPPDRIRLIKNLLRPFPRQESKSLQASTLNSYGDETANTVGLRTKDQLYGVKKAMPEVFSHNEGAWKVIAKFVSDAKKMGVRVVLTYPNLYSEKFDMKHNGDFFREIPERAKKAGIEVVGTASGAAFNEEDIFDTIYHQNTQGQIRSTDRLFKDLRNAGVI